MLNDWSLDELDTIVIGLKIIKIDYW